MNTRRVFLAPPRLSSRVRALANHQPSDLPAVFASTLRLPDPAAFDAIYSPVRTFWLFLHQVLSPGTSCQEIVHKVLAWMAAERGGESASHNTSGYCQARRRLALPWLHDIAAKVVEVLEERGKNILWHGRRVLLVDGSSVSMPDTLENQLRWPQPRAQKPGCGFPIMRLVALFSLATGAVLDVSTGPLELGEITLWRRLWGRLRRGDVVLADRGFSSLSELLLLSDRGIDVVARQHGARSSVLAREVKRLGRSDRLVEWRRDKNCPRWLERGWRKTLPKIFLVREITYLVEAAGFRTLSVTVVTTLLDPAAYPREAFVALYRRRWEAELRLRDLKTSMHLEILRCKTPEMIEKELAMALLGYNLVRAVMLEAALLRGAGADPVRLSFTSCLALLRQWAPRVARAGNETEALISLMLQSLSLQVIRSREGRREPRALKRRPKSYARLNKSRYEYRDIPHRNRYVKPTPTTLDVSAT